MHTPATANSITFTRSLLRMALLPLSSVMLLFLSPATSFVLDCPVPWHRRSPVPPKARQCSWTTTTTTIRNSGLFHAATTATKANPFCSSGGWIAGLSVWMPNDIPTTALFAKSNRFVLDKGPPPNDALTPNQMKVARKELNKRRRQQQQPSSSSGAIDSSIDNNISKLPTIFLQPDEGESFLVETGRLQEIAALLLKHEMVQVRGISKRQIRAVKAIAEQLALDVAMEITAGLPNDSPQENDSSDEDDDDDKVIASNNPAAPYKEIRVVVFVVEISGHAAVLYCPQHDEPSGASPVLRIQLRTTGKWNQWEKRIKAPRDNRGQIIR